MMNSLYLVAATATVTTTSTAAAAAAVTGSRGLVRTSSGFVTTTSTLYPPIQTTTAAAAAAAFRRHRTMMGNNKLTNTRNTVTSPIPPMMMARRDFSSGSSSSSNDEDETAPTSSKKSKKELPYPRASVAVAVRCCYNSAASATLSDNNKPHYLLVQRGNPPNAGRWSFPGGKLELGETTLDGARRELAEETQFRWNNQDIVGSSTSSSSSSSSSAHNGVCSLLWYLDGSWTTADSIVWASSETTDEDQEQESQSNLLAHYLIGICFAEIKVPPALTKENPSNSCLLPAVEAMDDAADAKFFTIEQIHEMQSKQETTPGIFDKVQRAELLYQNGMLPTSD